MAMAMAMASAFGEESMFYLKNVWEVLMLSPRSDGSRTCTNTCASTINYYIIQAYP